MVKSQEKEAKPIRLHWIWTAVLNKYETECTMLSKLGTKMKNVNVFTTVPQYIMINPPI